MEGVKWHALSIDEVLRLLHSSYKGLEDVEAKNRLKKQGFNILNEESKETAAHILLRQLHNPLVYVLLISSLIAFLLGKWIDGSVILCVVVLNSWIGFAQEYPASRMIKQLASLVPHESTALRSGHKCLLSATHLVVGDVIVLQPGDKVPADLRLLEATRLECDESVLTGESEPRLKQIDPAEEGAPLAERSCMAYSGCYVTCGSGIGVVTATGYNTEFGKIAHLLNQVEKLKTPLSLVLGRIAFWITLAVLCVSGLIVLVGHLRTEQFFDSVLAAVALAVAAIPEGLPAIITMASAIGVRRMASRKVIIRQLPAVEALGSTNVICTDKTGTLTHNEMTVQKIWTQSGFSFVVGVGLTLDGEVVCTNKEEVEELLRAAVLCNDASFGENLSLIGDPTEGALIVAARKAGLVERVVRIKWKRLDSVPFDPARRLMATLHGLENGERALFIKGAPEELATLCMGKGADMLEAAASMADEGMRLLAVAKKEGLGVGHERISEEDLRDGFTLLGLAGMADPIRKEVITALAACSNAQVAVKVVTGDHPKTALAVARELGMRTDYLLTGKELDALDEQGWQKAADQCALFARTSPEHKLKLVEALQKKGLVVAMTGDGVNDAAALKKADIGIAMGIKGTAVAKQAADMVLVDDNFANIERAIVEGRRVYDNLIKALAFIFPTSLAQGLVILVAVLFFPIRSDGLLLPIEPVQILWINLVVAVALALPLAFEAHEPDSMQRPPRKKQAPIFSRQLLIRTLSISFLMCAVTITLFLLQYGLCKDCLLDRAQTMAVTTLIFMQIFYLFNCRSLKYSIFKMGLFSNPYVWLGSLLVVLSQLAFVYLPLMNRLFHTSALPISSWLISFFASLTLFPLIAVHKMTKWHATC